MSQPCRFAAAGYFSRSFCAARNTLVSAALISFYDFSAAALITLLSIAAADFFLRFLLSHCSLPYYRFLRTCRCRTVRRRTPSPNF